MNIHNVITKLIIIIKDFEKIAQMFNFNIALPEQLRDKSSTHHLQFSLSNKNSSCDINITQVRYLMRGINGEKLGLKCLNVGKILTI